jgi:hypothetical protein
MLQGVPTVRKGLGVGAAGQLGNLVGWKAGDEMMQGLKRTACCFPTYQAQQTAVIAVVIAKGYAARRPHS